MNFDQFCLQFSTSPPVQKRVNFALEGFNYDYFLKIFNIYLFAQNIYNNLEGK